MIKLFVFSIVILSNYASVAHPGIGIVKDSKGNIYYTDLTHVWKIDPAGRRTVAVRQVHTHELYIDNNNNIFGEHVWYNGERLNTWGHYVWCLRTGGVVVKIKKETGDSYLITVLPGTALATCIGWKNLQ